MRRAHQSFVPFLLSALFCALAFSAALAQQRAGDIDWPKARGLYQRQRRGEKLTAEEQAYLKRAIELRRAGKGPRRGNRGPRIAPTHADVKYGPHERNVLDFWKAASDKPTPLVVYIHGGGFKGGNKHGISSAVVKQCLASGVSVAAIHYRFVQHAPLPASLYDSARAIQFLRSKAAEWNIDKTRVATFGGSAGGCTSLWLAFHDDLADPKSDDPVKRESTRLTCVAGSGAQSTLDPRVMREWLTDRVLQYPELEKKYGAPSVEALVKDPKYVQAFGEASPINHLTADDPPVFLEYGRDGPITPKSTHGFVIHHAILGTKLKEAMDKIGVECVVRIAGKANQDPYENKLDFFFRKFGIAPGKAAK